MDFWTNWRTHGAEGFNDVGFDFGRRYRRDFFWLISAVVKKKATPQGQVPELGLELVDNRGIDLVETNAAQSRWSAWAAFAAAIAAIFQAIATYLSQIPTA